MIKIYIALGLCLVDIGLVVYDFCTFVEYFC